MTFEESGRAGELGGEEVGPVDCKDVAIDAYAAGFIDGEGYIGIEPVRRWDARDGRFVRVDYRLHVSVSQADARIATLDFLADHYGGAIYRHGRETAKNKSTSQYVAYNTVAENLLARVHPYLIAKHLQADLALGFWRLRAGKPNGVSVREWMAGASGDIAGILARICRELNSRGPAPATFAGDEGPESDVGRLVVYGLSDCPVVEGIQRQRLWRMRTQGVTAEEALLLAMNEADR